MSVLALPLYIIIKSDEKGEFTIKFKFLFKIFESNGESESSIGKTLKELIGADKLNKKHLQKDTKRKDFGDTLRETLSVLGDFFKELCSLLGHCTAKRFRINVICRGDDAADAALKYGKYCGIIYPAAGLLASLIKIKKQGQSINILCDYTSSEKDELRYDFLISIPVFRLLGAFLRIAYKGYTKKQKPVTK